MRPTLVVGLLTLGLAQGSAAQAPQGTGFSYQGRLLDGATPGQGSYDFQFILYDAAVGGSQVGPIVVRDDVAVTSGLFTVTLDFGPAFGGSKRWLDIAVRPGSSTGAYTPLVPRQELTPGPSASFSAAAPWTGITGKPVGFADDVDDDRLGGLACASGQVAKWNGSAWACAADAVNAGTVTSIASGAGLTGGPITSSGTLSVSFGGSGAAATAARSDHNHHGQLWTGANTVGLIVDSSAASGTGLEGRAGSGGGFGRGVVGETQGSSGLGVLGQASSPTGQTIGVYGQSLSSMGTGVYAIAGLYGVQGFSDSTGGTGVFGWQTATTGLTHGVRGWSSSTNGRGVSGAALSTTGGVGVEGQAASTAGIGVFGWASSTSGLATGVQGRTDSTLGRGLVGLAFASTGSTMGIYGDSLSSNGRGVFGFAGASTGQTRGVWGQAASTLAAGVYGEATATSGFTSGVQGVSASSDGRGVYGRATSSLGLPTGVLGEVVDGFAVRGLATGTGSGIALYGVAVGTVGLNYGLYAYTASPGGYAGYFDGRTHVNGTFSKAAGSFRIDHPLDPENKYLSHSFVESPDMMNIYNGNVITDADGLATVTLPDWFEALNRDFRYQLTVLGDGAWARARVYRQVAEGAFVVQTDLPRVEVSWQVTGIRKDPYAEKHRIPVEQDKPDAERGTYLNPDAWGVPAERGTYYRRARAVP